MATRISTPHLQLLIQLSGILIADYNWLHPIVFAVNTYSPVENFTSNGVVDLKKSSYIAKNTQNLVAKIVAAHFFFTNLMILCRC